MDAKSMMGLAARDGNGNVVGRIVEIIPSDGDDTPPSGVIVETESGEMLEIPLTSIEADEDADFATFHADRSDEEPGDHTGDAESPASYAPNDMIDDGPDDTETEGQFVALPDEEDEVMPPEEVTREDWQDEADTPDSGYPRNDTYIDPETGEEDIDPALKDSETVEDDVEELLEVLEDTGMEVTSAKDGVIVLRGGIASREDLDALEAEILGLDGVTEVDTTDVEIEEVGQGSDG